MADPNCPWCRGRGYVTGGDEVHECWCVRDRQPVAESADDEGIKSPPVEALTFTPAG